MGVGSILKRVDAFPKIIDIEVNKTFSGAIRKIFNKCTRKIIFLKSIKIF